MLFLDNDADSSRKILCIEKADRSLFILDATLLYA